MNNFEDYKVHIQYTFNAFCKVVIRYAAMDIILKLRRRWEREVSLLTAGVLSNLRQVTEYATKQLEQAHERIAEVTALSSGCMRTM